MIVLNPNSLPRRIFIGYERENDARAIGFDLSTFEAEYGAGVLQLLMQRPGETEPYPVLLTVSGSVATWLPSATDTAIEGEGRLQMIYTVNSIIAKTAVISVLIEHSLGAGTAPPSGYETWLEELTQLAADTQQNAAEAAESAEQASDAADTALDAKTAALAAQAGAQDSALVSEGFAVGKQSGEPVASGSQYFENNAKFYSEAAQQAASEGGWVHFYIDANGDLHYVKTPNVDLVFYLQGGDLYVKA